MIKYIAIAGTIILVINACSEDFLDTTPTSAFTEASYVKNAEELETLLYTCYSVITCYYPPPNWAFFNLPFNMFIIGNVGSDDAEKGGDARGFAHAGGFLVHADCGNMWTFFFWHINYYLIAKCNLVIDKSEEVEGDEGGDRKNSRSGQIPACTGLLQPGNHLWRSSYAHPLAQSGRTQSGKGLQI